MTSAPFRPAREIAISSRRLAREDAASYDHILYPATPAAPQPPADILDFHPGQPSRWPAFTKAIAGLAVLGVLLLVLADLYLLGAGITVSSAVIWGLARIATFRHNGDRHNPHPPVHNHRKPLRSKRK